VGPVSRFGDQLVDVGRSKELVEALFEQIAVGEVADRVFEVQEPNSFVVVKLVSRTDADMEKLAKDEASIRTDLRQRKAVELLAAWLKDRCQKVASAGEVEVNRGFLYEDPEAEQAIPYRACQYIEIGSVLGQQQTRLLSDMF
jgi:hypothetical protein